MDPAPALRRSGRARRKAEYKESSSSSDDPIKSLSPSPSRVAKRKRENRRQKQNPSNLDDPPLVPYHLHTSSIQSREPRGESDASACSLHSDVPIFPYLEGRRRNSRALSNSSSWTLPSDVPIFPYIQEKRFNARASIAARSCHEKEDSKHEILGKSFEFKSSTQVFVLPRIPQVHDQKYSQPIKAPSLTQSTTPKPLSLPSINSSQEIAMAPGVSGT